MRDDEDMTLAEWQAQEDRDDLETAEEQDRLARYENEGYEFCDDCGREIRGNFCSACREHERRRDNPLRLAEMRLMRKGW